MKDIKKPDDGGEKPRCGYSEDCGNYAVARIVKENTVLHLCDKHREKLEKKMRKKIKEKYEGMSEEEIAEKIFKEGGSFL